MAMTRPLILAAVLLAATTATTWGQSDCDEVRQLRTDTLWWQANAAFEAGKRAADETYREEFRTANSSYDRALARAEAAYDGLYWALRDAEHRDGSAVGALIADALAERAERRNAAYRKRASSMSDMMSRWSDSMENAEIGRSVFMQENVLLIERQFSECRSPAQ